MKRLKNKKYNPNIFTFVIIYIGVAFLCYVTINTEARRLRDVLMVGNIYQTKLKVKSNGEEEDMGKYIRLMQKTKKMIGLPTYCVNACYGNPLLWFPNIKEQNIQELLMRHYTLGTELVPKFMNFSYRTLVPKFQN